MNNKEILSIKLVDEFEGETIASYLTNLLRMVWVDGESFNGKRPFGNSGWEYDLYAPLVSSGVIDGELDDGGYIEFVDKTQANKVILSLIDDCFK